MTATYWDARYLDRRGPGWGSGPGFLEAKAGAVNDLVRDLDATRTLDLGCGDGRVARLLEVPGYLGLDPSREAVRLARRRCPHLEFRLLRGRHLPDRWDLTLSLDVVQHLVEDRAYLRHLELVCSSVRWAIVHAPDRDPNPLSAPHVCYRRWTWDLPGWWRVARTVRHEAVPSDTFLLERLA